MMHHRRFAVSLLATIFLCLCSRGETVRVRAREGTVHGFLTLRDENGKRLATGDLIQTVNGDVVTARLVFRFRDGSVDDEESDFRQNGIFRLLHDHHVQKGPAFPHPMDVVIDAVKQEVTERSKQDGKVLTATKHVDIPEDLANGLPLILVKNIPSTATLTKVPYLAATPELRMVHLAITPDGSETFSIGSSKYKASIYRFHVELGGIAGVLAPLMGKEPKDDRVWVVGGEAPSFVRAQVAFYVGGPLWTIDLTSPVLPDQPSAR